MKKEKYHYYNVNYLRKNRYGFIAECSSKKRIAFGFFFICRKMAKCRSPPFINFEFENLKLIGGKKNGYTPKKKKI